MAKKKRESKRSVDINMPQLTFVQYISKPVAKSIIWLAIIVAVWQSKHYWQHYVLPIKSIHVIGAVDKVQSKQIQQLLADYKNQSLLLASLEDAHQMVVANPWVKHAAFKRSWPNQLVVQVEEQQTVAVLNENMLVNKQYDVFHSVEDISSFEHLLKIQANENQIEHVMEFVEKIAALFSDKSIGLLSVNYSKRGSWELGLTNDTVLKLGRHDIVNRVKRYVNLLPVFEKQQKKMVSADLRYDTGLAVEWASESSADRLGGN